MLKGKIFSIKRKEDVAYFSNVLHKNASHVKFSLHLKKGWFGQPTYSTTSKKTSYVADIIHFPKLYSIGDRGARKWLMFGVKTCDTHQ